MNRNRPISDLLHDQIDHLHKAELTLPPDQQTGVDVHSIQTETEAAAYIQQVMAKLHPKTASAGGY